MCCLGIWKFIKYVFFVVEFWYLSSSDVVFSDIIVVRYFGGIDRYWLFVFWNLLVYWVNDWMIFV